MTKLFGHSLYKNQHVSFTTFSVRLVQLHETEMTILKAILILITFIIHSIKSEEIDTTTIPPTEAAITPAQSDCETFLANKTALQACCLLPENIDVLIQQNCYKSCSSSAPRDQLDSCALECYLSVTGLYDKQVFSKPVAKRIYNFNSQNINWIKLIEEAVDRCDFVPGDSVEQSVLKFYNCADDYLTENCASFLQNPNCDSVEEKFESCRAKAYDCTKWPCGLVSPEACCESPRIQTLEMIEKCALQCQRKEILIRKKAKCNFNCTLVDTGIVVEGKVNFANIKKVLVENANKPEWEKPIESAMATCEGRYRGEHRTFEVIIVRIYIHFSSCRLEGHVQ